MFQNLDHIAMAVRNIDEKRQIFENLLSFTFLSEEIIETEKVKVVYLKSPGTKIELIQPLEGNQSLTKFLEKKGEAIHHICYLVSN
ncbi:MAG: methylmalonyl-CoA epimerase, partial [Planctomycetota bacterium]